MIPKKAIQEVEFIQQNLPYGTVINPGKQITLAGLHFLERHIDTITEDTEDTEDKGQPYFIFNSLGKLGVWQQKRAAKF